MKHYLIKDSINWADECDVHFFELLDEDMYNKYMICKDILKEWYNSYYFGTNEGWEDDEFDYLNFEPIELTDEEYQVLKKFDIEGEKAIEYFFDDLQDSLQDADIISDTTSVRILSINDFKRAVEKYADMRYE